MLVTLAGVLPPGAMAQSIELFPLTNTWRFEPTGAAPGNGWTTAGFNDSAWSSGPGVLAVEWENPIVAELTRTPLSRIGVGGYKITDYFRARFVVPEPRPGWFIIASNLVDDGAVFYLNGVEWFRHNMPVGEVNSNTLAVETIDSGREGVFAVTNLSGSGLVAGENVLAVEVHQPYVTSTDTVLGTVLIYAPQQPPAITREPRNRVVSEGMAASIDVGATGSVPRFQWFREGTPIPGATQAVLSWPNASRVAAGHYQVVVANDVGSVTSQVATLTLALDDRPPMLISAQKNFFVDVIFSEPIDPSTATNPASYRVTGPGGSTLPVQEVYVYSENGVGLNVGNLTTGFNHLLFVREVRDPYGNEIEPDSGIAVAIARTNLALASVWRFDDTGRDLGTAWRESSFDDSAWPSGSALLYNDSSFALTGPGVRGATVRVTNAAGFIVTHYFRQRFTNPVSAIGGTLTLRHYVDDGAVFYLNGREVLRQNLGPGELGFDAYAPVRAFEGVFSAPIFVSAEHLIVGENVLAVEVHQYEGAAPDISFGAELTVAGTLLSGEPPRVLTQPQAMTVTEGSSALWQTHVTEAESVQWWRDETRVAGATRTDLVLSSAVAEWDGAEFSLVASNRFGTVRSRAARLTVIPDRIPPRVIAARAGTNLARIVLSFSEPVDPVTAQEHARYQVTSASGGGAVVLAAALTNATNVVLDTTPRAGGDRYSVAAAGVRDRSASGNASSASSVVGVEQEILLLGYTQVWRYEEGLTNLGTLWRAPEFDDAAWPSGPGLLGFENPLLLPAPLLTTLTPPDFSGVTDYFRTRFTLDRDPTPSLLRLRHVVDDGVVFYLNGRELHRLRVPEGHNFGTFAVAAVESQVEGPFDFPGTTLMAGLNSLAAEVHQNTTVSADVVFGAELTLVYPPVPPSAGATLDIERWGDAVLVNWDAFDYALERAPSPTGPWERVSAPRWPHVESIGTPEARFFRLIGTP